MTEQLTAEAAVQAPAVQVYRVYIKATPEAIWEAITKPEWSAKYGYGGLVDYDLRAGGQAIVHANEGMKQYGTPDVIIDGEVLECDPPRKLVQTWRMLMDESMAAEGFTTLTYEIDPMGATQGWQNEGVTRLTVTHDLTDAPALASMVAGGHEESGAGGGWNEVLSGLKTLLETGSALA